MSKLKLEKDAKKGTPVRKDITSAKEIREENNFISIPALDNEREKEDR